jgi:DNA-binding MurR/RpiR family transcriptional regulator
MSKSFAKLADFLLDSYIEAAFMTASELAQELNLDAATVVRFSQSLGYPGFPKLQREIRQRVKNNLLYAARQIEKDDSSATIVAGSLSKLSQLIEQTRISLDIRAFEALLDRINQSGRIVIV